MKHIRLPQWMIDSLPVTDIRHVLHEIEVRMHVHAMMRVQGFKSKAYKLRIRKKT